MDHTQARLAAAVYLAQCQRRATFGNYARGVLLAASHILQVLSARNPR
jgi:hypothetical protein